MIPVELLETYNAKLKTYTKDATIFEELDTPIFYYQINSGSVKMINLSEDGKEFAQGIFYDGNAFGEPPLFGDFKYPATALCVQDSSIYILPKDTFFDLLKAHPDIHLNFTKLLCKRMIYKAKIMKEVSIHPPEHRIMTLLEHLKNNFGNEMYDYEVELTRQDISNLTGLRVETVIRSIKKLEKNNKLSIRDRKVYL
ncbi:Crp/Fnr family transcriptional regulator [uncultured Psychroserpens sp.]|uniref:Crp/Fnr family transcriptional regulator n=1 Tax=uncultured Psychroserpens sp. TaxID=255436 RepID=UPI00262FCC2B|nr:Crp/Fnr family transcriptional regulator [uncultured Psychroserpens sp.]